MELDFSSIDIDRDISDEELSFYLNWTIPDQDQDTCNCPLPAFPLRPDFLEYQAPAIDLEGMGQSGSVGLDPHASGLADSPAGIWLIGSQSSGSDSSHSGENGSDEDEANTGYKWCCEKKWKLGRDYNKHYHSRHNRRFHCHFYDDCQYVAPDNKDLIRHCWVYHEAYAIAKKMPILRAECPACGIVYGRKDRPVPFNFFLLRFSGPRKWRSILDVFHQ
ncbi:hypothetical protein FZEAL_10318 [Fusarium zealandicum]|uniref:Uncharacterized protein n=1 Tax=Fusarium zealandicum TaxID=1053134 RepID=A0A8H4U369_9HYPO|nr:hypothetical protein FZEAL_10318 [Fusarium zealandicum]